MVLLFLNVVIGALDFSQSVVAACIVQGFYKTHAYSKYAAGSYSRSQAIVLEILGV